MTISHGHFLLLTHCPPTRGVLEKIFSLYLTGPTIKPSFYDIFFGISELLFVYYINQQGLVNGKMGLRSGVFPLTFISAFVKGALAI